MPRVRKCNEKLAIPAPAITPEGQEVRMTQLAIDLAEKQLEEGTASSQIISHYLKLGTEKAKLETEKIKKEISLMDAKIEDIKASQRSKELYENAIEAFKKYSGYDDEEEGYYNYEYED